MAHVEPDEGTRPPSLDRAVRLFQFLARSQQLKSRPPVTVDSYDSVLWLREMPDHPAVRTAYRHPEPVEFGGTLLELGRPGHIAPPEPDDRLAPWLDGPLDDTTQPPRLRDSRVEGTDADVAVRIEDQPDITEAFQRWSARWSAWAERESRDRPVRALYQRLFAIYVAVTGHSEEVEVVLGVGCLSWTPAGHEAVKRHLITARASVDFDDDTGRLSVRQQEPPVVELDMLDPGLVANPPLVVKIKAEAQELAGSVLDRDLAGGLARRLVHGFDGDGGYLDEDEARSPTERAMVAFAPALILRRRSRQALADVLNGIADELAESGSVPDGLLPLVDPDHLPAASGSAEPGAVVTLDDDPFLPLPVNDAQLRILRAVDSKAQVLVQGPPGTGKTHTAAALLSHLLAQGKRVLVTAHTDRALKEVRAKLPAAIAPLAVSVVGSSRSDMSDLKVAVEQINQTAVDHDPVVAQRRVDECLAAIDALRRERAALHRRLLDARGQEVVEHEVRGYAGTLAVIGQRIEAERDRFGWLADLVVVEPTAPLPLPTTAMIMWHRSLVDADLNADAADALSVLFDPARLPDPETFSRFVGTERAAIADARRLRELTSHPAFAPMRRLDEATRSDVRQRLDATVRTAAELTQRHERWIDTAVLDVRIGRATIWKSRHEQIEQLATRVGELLARLGTVTDVRVTGGDVGTLVALASALSEHLRTGGRIRTNPDGSPKAGAFASKLVKHAQELFESVRVNGVPPTTAEYLDAFLAWVDATRSLSALDKAWPDSVEIPVEDTFAERLQWHRTELQPLRRVVALGDTIERDERWLGGLGLPRPDWSDLDAVRTYTRVIDAVTAEAALAAATRPLAGLARTVDDLVERENVAACVRRLAEAILRRDIGGYATEHRRLVRLVEVRRVLARRDEIAATLAAAVPAVYAAVLADPDDHAWPPRLSAWESAWTWAQACTWVLRQGGEDVNRLQADVSRTEQRIQEQVAELAAVRAWRHAVAPERLSGTARANLQQYAQLVKGLGRGTGKYAEQRRAEIRVAMDRCRPAVPVWIMPIYRIAEQLQVTSNMFDVVIVDEASQAGLEATFLQCLAPRIVVIGDDKQVSPSAVGVDQQRLRDLADQYLWDDPFRASWQDPKRSLFDEAKMRFEGRITLTEHRRCVPEIIGFSNRIAYEPENIRLVPVRQYGADRLEPIRPVFLADGYEKGVTAKVNPVEVDAIVDQIEKCVADPRYDGLTFGVISLLGQAQAKLIETRLLERVPPEEWAARELRCGDSADFQGSERDVMFLSMVKAPEPGRRIGALTQDQYVQRYNVAASRARDQMWVFHSVRLADMGNREDMRFQLLDYCYGVTGRTDHGFAGVSGVVPEDTRVEPFDSLFEQRVFNRIVDRGHAVLPQFPVEGYRLDLVVMGAKSRLAVECDGDAWHGPEAYEHDMARQRDLERCGWHFFRIRESEFYVDQAAVMSRLWAALEELDIRPSDWITGADETIVNAAPVAESVLWPDVELDVESGGESDEGVAESGGTVSETLIALEPYQVFDGQVVPVGDATRRELIDGIVQVVAAEGPMLGRRLSSAYVRASGGQRVTKNISEELNRAIAQAVRDGRIVEDNPLNENAVRQRTYRLPDHPVMRPRELGPRLFDELPPAELAALIARVAQDTGAVGERSVQRTVLAALGLKRRTGNVQTRFTAVADLLP